MQTKSMKISTFSKINQCKYFYKGNPFENQPKKKLRKPPNLVVNPFKNQAERKV